MKSIFVFNTISELVAFYNIRLEDANVQDEEFTCLEYEYIQYTEGNREEFTLNKDLPSSKQINAINIICENLGLEYSGMTKGDAHKFISKYLQLSINTSKESFGDRSYEPDTSCRFNLDFDSEPYYDVR